MYQVFYISLFVLYILGMTAVMIWQGIGIAPDRYAFILLVAALLIKRSRQFLLDWIPFLFILIAYDFLRGFADNLSTRVHFVELYKADKWIFGVIPTEYLQYLFYQSDNLRWYDFVATIFYFLHFALPLAFGFLLWNLNKIHFRQFVVAILLLSYAGWVTYIIYPAAPPWMAADKGYLFGVSKVIDQTLNIFPEKISLPTIYHQINPNQVAAIPSMHAAYPMLVLLYSMAFFGLRGLIFIPYVLLSWASIVYLGEHYVIDVIMGALYALIFFGVAKLLFKHVKFLHGQKR